MQDLHEAICVQGRTKHVIALLELVTQHHVQRQLDLAPLLASVNDAVRRTGELRASSSLLRKRGFDGQAARPMTSIVLTGAVHHCHHILGDDSCHQGLANLRISDVERLSALLPELKFSIGYVLPHSSKSMRGMGAARGHDVVLLGVPSLRVTAGM